MQNNWTSVKNRVPFDVENKVLVCFKFGSRQEIGITYWNKKHNCFDHFMEDMITHWMLLPELPKTKQP